MAELILVLIISVIISPITLLAVIIVTVLEKVVLLEKFYAHYFVMLFAVVLIYIGIKNENTITPFEIFINNIQNVINQKPISIDFSTYLKSNFMTSGIALILEMISLIMISLTPAKAMIRDERRKEFQKMRVKKINYIPSRSSLVVGVSGAGKSVFLSKSVDEINRLEPDSFIVVVDGKGSTEKFSLYYNMKIIAKKYNKKLIIINGTSNCKLGKKYVYDFLDGVETIDAMKDMVMALIDNPTVEASAGSEHYKILTERYLVEIISFMKRNKIDITLGNIIKLLIPPDELEMLINKMNLKNQHELIRFVNENYTDVRASIEKLRLFIKGQGGSLFVGKGEKINLRKAYHNKNVMVLVLADEMSMPQLASKLVQLVTFDLRNLVAGRLTNKIDMERKIYSIYDEFSSYTSSIPYIKSLYARARSAECVLTIATQSCSDIKRLGNGFFDIICDTADRFVVFRQNSADAAESASSLFGTELHVTDTLRTSDLLSTGEASNTADRAFIVPPDLIRNLEKNHGFLLDKTAKKNHQIKYFKNQFVKG